MKKLAINVPANEDIYDYQTRFVCLACPDGSSDIQPDAKVRPSLII